jgi:excisionase family DNA binding protein
VIGMNDIADKTQRPKPRSLQSANHGVKRWISPSECATLFGMHPQSIYALIARGEIPAGRIGRAVRIDRHALEAQLDAQIQENGVRWRGPGSSNALRLSRVRLAINKGEQNKS